jgi:hypothetical protein
MPIGTPVAHKRIPAKTVSVTIKLTPVQYRNINQRSEKLGVRVAVWMRTIVCHAATKEPDIDGYIRIREPDGMTT